MQGIFRESVWILHALTISNWPDQPIIIFLYTHTGWCLSLSHRFNCLCSRSALM